MSTKGYHSYRGRQTARQRILIVLLVVILCLACSFLFLQSYISYDDDGSLRFDTPFGQEEVPDQPDEPELPDMNLIIDAPGSMEPEEEEEPKETTCEAYRLVELGQITEDGTSLRSALEQAGANGFAYTVRDNTGRVFYPSVAALRSAVEAPAGSDRLAELCGQEDIRSVARFNCLHDSYYAWMNMTEAGICQSNGHIWYDNISYHWLDAEKEKACQYVVGLAREMAEMGFDELLLEELSYPANGKLEKIDYSGNTREKTEALKNLLLEIRETVQPYGTGLTMVLDARLLDETTREDYIRSSGVDPSVLLPLVDAVYVETEDLTGAESALAALVGEQMPAVVPMTNQGVDGERWYLTEG